MMFVVFSATIVSAEESNFSGIVSKNIYVTGDGDVEIPIDIAGNPGLIVLGLNITYDSDALVLNENGVTDTELLKGIIDPYIDRNPFKLSWQHSDGTSENNYANGTIAILSFKMQDGFYGTTKINIDIFAAQTYIDSIVSRPPPMENAVIYDLENNKIAKEGLADVPYSGIVEGYFNVNEMSSLLQQKFERFKELIQKAILTDDDFEEIARLEMFLNEIPDYLALDITTEYKRLKMEFENREDV